MTDRLPDVAAALDRLVPPVSRVGGDWERVRRDARPRAGRAGLLVAAVAAVVVAVPALGGGRLFSIPWLADDPNAAVVAAGSSPLVGPWTVVATGGGGSGITMELAIAGEPQVQAGGVDAGLPGGATPGPRHWVGYVMYRPRPPTQFVFGPAAAGVERVELELADGRRVAAGILVAARELRTDLRFYVAELPPTQVDAVVAYDRDGNVLERRRVPPAPALRS
jgi:hypothetical protein